MAQGKETRVGMIGLGAMGEGIALNLAATVKASGLAHPLLVWEPAQRAKQQRSFKWGRRYAQALP